MRPLRDTARAADHFGWNFGQGWPPSYQAYGRMRALFALTEARRLDPNRMLEVAAGDAALCASLASEGREVFANDLRKEHLEQAVQCFENRDEIHILPGNLFDLDPAETGLFDLVVACEILEHVAHTVAFLRQLKRFLRPGGRLLVTTPNGSCFSNRLPTYSQIDDFDSLERRQFKPDADGHLFLITPAEMCQLADEAGLAVERIDVWGTMTLAGHFGLRTLSARAATRFCFLLENLFQRLPFRAREGFCTSLSVVLANQESG